MRAVHVLAQALALAASCAIASPALAQSMSVDEIRANIDAQIRARDGTRAPANTSATRSLKINNHQDTQEPLYDKPPPAPPPLIFNIEFDYNSDRPRADAQPILSNIAAALKDPSFADRTFLIIGHTDSKGSADYNRALSLRRASATVAALVKLGAPASQLAAQGRGEDEPRKMEDGHEATDAENRRVEVKLQ